MAKLSPESLNEIIVTCGAAHGSAPFRAHRWFATLPKGGFTRRVGVGGLVAQSHRASETGGELNVVEQYCISLVSRTAIECCSNMKSHSEAWLSKRMREGAWGVS